MRRQLGVLLWVLLLALPVAAAEEGAAPAGLGWLFLLLGLGAITVIGFVMFAREQASENDTNAGS
ncbi:MAG: hypothetical protein SNJ54_10560 [Anaerolineae bacterium]